MLSNDPKARQDQQKFQQLLDAGDTKALTDWLSTSGYKPSAQQQYMLHTNGILFNPNSNSYTDVNKTPAGTPATPTSGVAKALVAPTDTTPAANAAADRSEIEKEGQREFGQETTTLGQQTSLQQTRLNDLAKLLAQQQNNTFNREIPQIANTAQNAGFLETSGFGNALAREEANLTTDTSTALAKQALADRQLQIEGIGTAGTNQRGFEAAGLSRQFSVEDKARADALARELGKMGVPSERSTGQNFLAGAVKGAGAGAAFGPWGAAIGGVTGGVANSK